MQTFALTALAALVLLQLAGSSVLPRATDTQTQNAGVNITANMNKYFDRVVVQVHDYIIEKNYDPMALPDIGHELSVVDWVGIRWHGGLTLSNGSLKGISNLKRAGNATLSYQNTSLDVSVIVAFDTLTLDYTYKADIMSLGPRGHVTGEADGVIVFAEIVVNLATMKVDVKKVDLIDASKLRVHLTGLWLLDNLINPISDVVTSIFKKSILDVVEKRVREEVQKAVASIDISSILGDN